MYNFRMPISYHFIEAKGTNIELGRQHGEQCRDQLRAFLDYLGSTLMLNRKQMHDRALRFYPLFERYCPHLVQRSGASLKAPEFLWRTLWQFKSEVKWVPFRAKVARPSWLLRGGQRKAKF